MKPATRLASPSFVACTVFLAALLVSSGAPASTGTVVSGEPRVLGRGALGDPPVVRVLANRPDRVELSFELPTLVAEDLPVGGQVFQGLSIPGGGESGETGHPMLPTFARLVQIPDRADVQVEATVDAADEYDSVRVIPMQDDDGTTFAYDPAAYALDGYPDVPPVQAGAPALMHGLRVVPVTFAPVQYNPVQGRLRVARRISVTVSFSGRNSENAGRPDARPIPESFDRMYRDLVVNYDRGGRDVRPGAWLLICPDSAGVVSDLQPLVTWRRRKGTATTVVTTAVTGTTEESIKSYIQNAYDTWDPPLEYVVLAGDAAGNYVIPTWFTNPEGHYGEGDHPYTQLDGTDILSDVHIGRLSFDTRSELQTIVAKIVGYESTPFVQDFTWFTRACLVGDPSSSGISCVQVMQWIKTRLLELGYAQVDTVFGGDFVGQMTTALNRGDTIFSYRGYIGMSGYTVGNVQNLTNGWRMPYAVISTCGTGNFFSGTSISEAFLKAGTPAQPKGAVAATGTATSSTHTRFNNCYVSGNLGGLLYEDLYTVGADHTRGKLELYLNYWNSAQMGYVTQFSYWNNLMGDPATECWTGNLSGITASYPASVPVGTNAITVSLSDASGALAGARVCLWKGSETWVAGTTDDNGRCELPVSLSSPGDLLLTATKHNHRPVLATIQVDLPDLFVAYDSCAVDDDATPPSHGNGDGRVNPGETIELPVRLRNFGSQPATAVHAVLTPEDSYVSVPAGSLDFGDLPAGASGWSASPALIAVDSGCPHGHTLRLALDVSSGAAAWHSIIDLPVISAELGFRELHWYNAGSDGILDPGESVGLSIALDNTGGLDAEAAAATLISLSEYITVESFQSTYPTIPTGGHSENVLEPFVVHAASGIFNGYSAPAELIVSFSGGIRDTVLVSLPIGSRNAADPTGPDRYGYIALDNTDTFYPNHPGYSWVEIDPAYGGSGTEVVLGDTGDGQDKTRTVGMPFPFRYYGQTYTTASICSNGWIVMGSTYLTDYRNWILPSLGGPDGVIAVFWDDLYQVANSKLYVKNDAVNHRWIVEWSRFKNFYDSSSTETFEAIFYDPVYYPTETGDGMIDFQYNNVANVDALDGYATIGIEKPDNSDGIWYTYFNNYSPGSASLGLLGRAIRFLTMRDATTGLPESERPATFGFDHGTPNPILPGGAVRFTIDRSARTTLSVHDAQGRVIRRLLDGVLAAGGHAVTWDGRDDSGREVPSGVYLYKLTSGGRSAVRKGILLR